MNEVRRYRVLETLGKGGFGTVYRAELLGSGGFSKQVAIKVLNDDGQREIALRLRDEARILGLLHHRAVVGVDNLVRLEPGWAVVMEYVAGIDATALIRYGPTPVRVVLEIVEEIASALHAAYTLPSEVTGRPLYLIHRDIKPSNLRITPRGEVKILDFGVAQASFGTREARTRATLFGSFQYMAPERLDGLDGPKGDIYSLGLVMARLLTGARFPEPPKHPRRHVAFAELVSSRVREALAEASPRVSEEAAGSILGVVTSMVSFEPSDRPTSRDVERFCREWRLPVEGPWLRDWAEQEVPRMIARTAAPPMDDSLSGSILTEITGGEDALTNVLPAVTEEETSETVAVRPWEDALPAAPPRPAPPPTARPPRPPDPSVHIEMRRRATDASLTGAVLPAIEDDDAPTQYVPSGRPPPPVRPAAPVAAPPAAAAPPVSPAPAPVASAPPPATPPASSPPVESPFELDPTDVPDPPSFATQRTQESAALIAAALAEARALEESTIETQAIRPAPPPAAGEGASVEVATVEVPTVAAPMVESVADTSTVEVKTADLPTADLESVELPPVARRAPVVDLNPQPTAVPEETVADEAPPRRGNSGSFAPAAASSDLGETGAHFFSGNTAVPTEEEHPTTRRRSPAIWVGLALAAVALFALWWTQRPGAGPMDSGAALAKVEAPTAPAEAPPAAAGPTAAAEAPAAEAPVAEPPAAEEPVAAAPAATDAVAEAPAPSAAKSSPPSGTARAATSSPRSAGSSAEPSATRGGGSGGSGGASGSGTSFSITASSPSRTQPEPDNSEPETPEPERLTQSTAVVIPTPPPGPSDGMGQIKVMGDAKEVRILSAEGRKISAGEVAPGTYNVEALFSDSSDVAELTVRVAAGEVVTLRCVEAFRRCTAR